MSNWHELQIAPGCKILRILIELKIDTTVQGLWDWKTEPSELFHLDGDV